MFGLWHANDDGIGGLSTEQRLVLVALGVLTLVATSHRLRRRTLPWGDGCLWIGASVILLTLVLLPQLPGVFQNAIGATSAAAAGYFGGLVFLALLALGALGAYLPMGARRIAAPCGVHGEQRSASLAMRAATPPATGPFPCLLAFLVSCGARSARRASAVLASPLRSPWQHAATEQRDVGPPGVARNSERRLHGLALLLVSGISLYLLIVLALAIAHTRFVEQDPINYCEVAKRFAAGEGLTSLSDRRGPADVTSFPCRFDAATRWPVLLAGFVLLTGEACVTGSILSLIALIGSIWLGLFAVRRATGVAALPAALCVTAALLHHEAVAVAVVPRNDSLSLFFQTACLLAIVARRPLWALSLAALAVVMRFQNAALVLPLLCLLPPVPAWVRVRTAAVAAAVLTTLAFGGALAVEGIGVFVNPADRDSLLRAVRFLFPPLLLGLWLARRWPPVLPFVLLGLGHLLVLLVHNVPYDSRPWLFALRHGLPFHLVAAALAALTLRVARGPVWWAAMACVLLAFGDNVGRPLKLLLRREQVTGRPELVLALRELERRPLGHDAVVLCYDADILAYHLRVKSVHLRSFTPAASGDPRLVDTLRARGITHVLLTWHDNKALAATRNPWMDEFERGLRPHTDVLADLRDATAGARALLLRLRR